MEGTSRRRHPDQVVPQVQGGRALSTSEAVQGSRWSGPICDRGQGEDGVLEVHDANFRD